MKTSLSVLAITFALFAIPAAAQQGPAGVPGAPLIGAVIAPAPTPEEKRVQQQQAKRAHQALVFMQDALFGAAPQGQLDAQFRQLLEGMAHTG